MITYISSPFFSQILLRYSLTFLILDNRKPIYFSPASSTIVLLSKYPLDIGCQNEGERESIIPNGASLRVAECETWRETEIYDQRVCVTEMMHELNCEDGPLHEGQCSTPEVLQYCRHATLLPGPKVIWKETPAIRNHIAGTR